MLIDTRPAAYDLICPLVDFLDVFWIKSRLGKGLFYNRAPSLYLPILGNLSYGRCSDREVGNLLLLCGVFVRKCTNNFADHQVTQTVALVKRPSHSLTFGHIFVLEALGNTKSVFISQRHYLILEELHLLDDFDEL